VNGAPVELRDAESARGFVLRSLAMPGHRKPSAAQFQRTLAVALELAHGGTPLFPLGMLADLQSILLPDDGEPWTRRDTHGWPAPLRQRYEDYVLGRLTTDGTVDRASDALRRYKEPERIRGLAYLAKQFRDHLGFGGVELSPAILRSLIKANPTELLLEAQKALFDDGPGPLVVAQYEELISCVRRLGVAFESADVRAIEDRTALAEMREYVAHRQLLVASASIEAKLPLRPVRPRRGQRDVATNVMDEDQYPIGGYSSIGNRGSIESLLHSQLAYIEENDRPDLFDIKYLRDELFFYTRDENRFLRRRRHYVVVLDPSLVEARRKDRELPYQRIVLALAMVHAIVRKLGEWLSGDALRFDIVMPGRGGSEPLADEAKLLETVLREERGRGAVGILHPGGADGWPFAANEDESWPERLRDYVLRQTALAEVHAWHIGETLAEFDWDAARWHAMAVSGPIPELAGDSGERWLSTAEDGEPFERWCEAALWLLEGFVA